jgi:hypothetical protein
VVSSRRAKEGAREGTNSLVGYSSQPRKNVILSGETDNKRHLYNCRKNSSQHTLWRDSAEGRNGNERAKAMSPQRFAIIVACLARVAFVTGTVEMNKESATKLEQKLIEIGQGIGLLCRKPRTMTIMQYRADQVVSVQLTFHHSETLNSLHPKLLLYVWRIVSAARETAEGAGRGGLLNSSFSEEEESVGAILRMRRW